MDVRIAALILGDDDLPVEVVEMPRVWRQYACNPLLALDGEAAVDGADDLRGEAPDADALVVARAEDPTGVGFLEMFELELVLSAILVWSM